MDINVFYSTFTNVFIFVAFFTFFNVFLFFYHVFYIYELKYKTTSNLLYHAVQNVASDELAELQKLT